MKPYTVTIPGALARCTECRREIRQGAEVMLTIHVRPETIPVQQSKSYAHIACAHALAEEPATS